MNSTVQKRQSRFGVGPKIALPTLTYAALAGAATHFWPHVCLLLSVPSAVFLIAGALLVLAGVALLIVAAVSVMQAYDRGQLVTSGVFALCRHAVYAAWIVLIVPGLMLLTKSWPLLLTPLVAYAVFKLLIHEEDDYLSRHFGPTYAAYRGRVNELIPFPRFRR